MPPSARAAPILCAATLCACVSVEDAPLAKDSIARGQRMVVLVFASPGPVMAESNSVATEAAKIVPGLGLLLAATQNNRDVAASKELQAILPPWRPDQLFFPILMKELAASGSPARLLGPADAGLAEDALAGMNRADDAMDWVGRYCGRPPEGTAPPRDYSSASSLADALVLEVNLAFGAPSDGKGVWTPNLSAAMKLYRASSMALIWRHDEQVEDKPGAGPSKDFKREPASLISRYQGLMPPLAQALSAAFKKNLQDAGLYLAP